MSLTVALTCPGGLVLAADSRVTRGYTTDGPRTEDTSVKFLDLCGGWGIQTYGLSEIGHAGITALRDEVALDPPRDVSPSSLLDRGVRAFARASAEWTSRHPDVPRKGKDVGFVLAGYDGERGAFRLFNLQSPDFSPEIVPQGCLVAGQWHVAKYFVRRVIPGEMSLEKTKELAVFLLEATMSVERTVGGAIRLAAVTPSAGFRWAGEDEVNALREKSRRFESLFRKELRDALSAAADGDGREGAPAGGDANRAG